jgi:CheY-like chemotaxis protein/MinD-like ATPase involved in chromosome partitioning or flagellar assembly
MLQRQGYQISAATSGQQGLDKALEEDPDLILLDVMMPDMDGYEVTRRLRRNSSTVDTPVLMFTAKIQPYDKVNGFEAGASDYLTKPTHPSELQARVKTLLSRAGSRKGTLPQETEKGYVIGVLGARGGLGATTLAVNLAAGLYVRTHADVVLAELLPGQGTLTLELGATPSEGLPDLLAVSKPNEITRERILEALVSHPSNLKLFLSSNRPRDMHLINQLDNYESIVKRLAGMARFLTLDMGPGLQPFAERVVPQCDEIVIVIEGNPNTIIHTKALIADLMALNIPNSCIHVVLNNRVRSDTQLPTSQVQAKLEHEIVTTLTPAPELFTQAARLQTPAVLCQPDSPTARQVIKLVDIITERETQPR